jgi:putative transcriptional regulator
MDECVSNCVYHLRTKAGLTQEELAEKVGVSRQTIIAIEKGNYTPSVLLAIKMGKVFKAPVEEIFKVSYEK